MVVAIIVWVVTAIQVLTYFQVRHHLVSPLISGMTVNDVAVPHLYSAGLLFIFGLIASIFFLFKRYIWVIVICASGLILHQIGHQYALFWTGI